MDSEQPPDALQKVQQANLLIVIRYARLRSVQSPRGTVNDANIAILAFINHCSLSGFQDRLGEAPGKGNTFSPCACDASATS